MSITFEQLQKIIPIDEQRTKIITESFNLNCEQFKITNFQVFLAQIIYESGDFRMKSEDLYYTSARRIQQIFPHHFQTEKEAEPYVRNEVQLACEVYKNRLGNGECHHDCFLFRGGGYIQITGRTAYEAYSKFINVELLKTIDLVRTTEKHAMESAAWYFADYAHLNHEEHSDFDVYSRRINGPPMQGYKERYKMYNKITSVLEDK